MKKLTELAKKHLRGKDCASQWDSQGASYRKTNIEQRLVEVHEQPS